MFAAEIRPDDYILQLDYNHPMNFSKDKRIYADGMNIIIID